MNLKDNKGGMLLYSIITSMVLSFIGVTLTVISLNQNIVIETEIERKESFSLCRAGFEYAYDLLGNNNIVDLVNNGVIIDDKDGSYSAVLPGYSDIKIEINPPIAGDPVGISWRIEVSAGYSA